MNRYDIKEEEHSKWKELPWRHIGGILVLALEAVAVWTGIAGPQLLVIAILLFLHIRGLVS